MRPARQTDATFVIQQFLNSSENATKFNVLRIQGPRDCGKSFVLNSALHTNPYIGASSRNDSAPSSASHEVSTVGPSLLADRIVDADVILVEVDRVGRWSDDANAPSTG